MSNKQKKKKYMRRENGTGTTYRLSGNRRRPWVAAVTVGWELSDDGKKHKQKKHIIGYFEERDDALRALLDYVPSVNEKVSEKTTIKEIFELIKEECEKENRSKDYMNNLNASYYPLEPLKDKALFSLNYMDFQDIIDNLINDPKQTSSHGKLTRVKGLVKRMYDVLIKYKVLDVNYAQYISLRGVKPGKVKAFPEEDIETLFKHDDDRIAKSSLILAYTGLRINEFLELEKEKNIDLENKVIIGGGKTEKGTDRLIAIHSKVFPYVEYFYNEYPDSKYLFTRDGEKCRYEYYREYYHEPLIKKLGLHDYGVNSFRHTAASKMKMAGLDDKAIEDMMGHTDIKFTEKQYIDINAKFLHEQMEKMK